MPIQYSVLICSTRTSRLSRKFDDDETGRRIFVIKKMSMTSFEGGEEKKKKLTTAIAYCLDNDVIRTMK